MQLDVIRCSRAFANIDTPIDVAPGPAKIGREDCPSEPGAGGMSGSPAVIR